MPKFFKFFLFNVVSIGCVTTCYSNEYEALITSCKITILSNSQACNSTAQSKVEIKGVSLLPTDVIDEILNSCNSQNPEIAILRLRQKINELYVCSGYINSGVLIKKNAQGLFYLEAIEGTVSENNIEISNTNLKSKNYIIRSLMGKQSVKTLNINDIRNKLELLKKSEVFKSINATVVPIPDTVGQAKIKISVSPSTPYKWAVSLNNQQSESTGENQITYSGSKQGVFSLFDSLGTSISISEGSQGLGISYANAISPTSNWEVSLERKESEIIQAPLSELDITSDFTKFSLGYNSKLRSSLVTHNKTNTSEDLTWQSKLELLDTNNYLLDRAFSFSAGENEGKTNITSLQTSLTWVKKHRSESYNGALSASVGLDLGVEAFGASEKTQDSAGSNYKILNAAVGYKRSMSEHSNVSINVNGQYSDDLLLAAKRIGLGGAGSVRGVDKNIASFDSNLTVSTESTVFLPMLSDTPFAVGSSIDGNLYGHLFADYSIGKDNRSNEKSGLGSLGLGLSWYPTKNSKLNLSWAKPVSFRGFTDDEINLIDDGRVDLKLIISGGK